MIDGGAEQTGYSHDLVDRLRRARHVAVLTGAGVSAASGIPTFRDKLVGLWENFDPEELATPAAFRRDPSLVWGWYEWRRMLVLRAQPNAAHRALAALADRVPQLTLITQNVDDLHERAGSHGVVHLHGRLDAPYCEACRRPFVFAAGIPDVPPGGARIQRPRCDHCGGAIRPGVVWFGENLPAESWRAAADAAQHCDAFLCIGTSSIVQPAASLTEMATRHGAMTVQINPNSTPADGLVTFALKGPAAKILPELLDAVWGPAGAEASAT